MSEANSAFSDTSGAIVADDDGDDRNVAGLMLDQLEFADVILLNKADMVSPEQLELLAAVLQRLNPGAKVSMRVSGQHQ